MDPPLPALIDGTLRATLFLSFLGRIVSVLAFKRRLLLVSVLTRLPRSLDPATNVACGMELTVSVSTVMFLTDPSVPLLGALVKGNWVNDLFEDTAAGLDELAAMGGFLGSLLVSGLAFVALFPALSLPLSGLDGASFAKASSIGFSSIRCGLSCGGALLVWFVRPPGIAGVDGKLLSCTVSSAGPGPLDPLTGVRMPDLGDRSSSATSESLARVAARVGRSTVIEGVVGVDCE